MVELESESRLLIPGGVIRGKVEVIRRVGGLLEAGDVDH